MNAFLKPAAIAEVTKEVVVFPVGASFDMATPILAILIMMAAVAVAVV